MKAHLILMLAFAATACAWQPSLVVMVGPAEGVSSLAGEWSAEYGSSETERSGTVWFKLAAGRDTAYGDAASVDDPIRARLRRSDSRYPRSISLARLRMSVADGVAR